MKRIKIRGKVIYQNLGTGFWGIIADNGAEYRPVNMPEQLKSIGAKVSCTAREIDDEVSIFMWGVPVKIISFGTITC